MKSNEKGQFKMDQILSIELIIEYHKKLNKKVVVPDELPPEQVVDIP